LARSSTSTIEADPLAGRETHGSIRRADRDRAVPDASRHRARAARFFAADVNRERGADRLDAPDRRGDGEGVARRARIERHRQPTFDGGQRDALRLEALDAHHGGLAQAGLDARLDAQACRAAVRRQRRTGTGLRGAIPEVGAASPDAAENARSTPRANDASSSGRFAPSGYCTGSPAPARSRRASNRCSSSSQRAASRPHAAQLAGCSRSARASASTVGEALLQPPCVVPDAAQEGDHECVGWLASGTG
jgi:hypothetical protein